MMQLKDVDNYLGIRALKTQKLHDLLSECTDKQVKFFKKMYGLLGEIPDDKLNWAIMQCYNTLENNNNHLFAMKLRMKIYDNNTK